MSPSIFAVYSVKSPPFCKSKSDKYLLCSRPLVPEKEKLHTDVLYSETHFCIAIFFHNLSEVEARYQSLHTSLAETTSRATLKKSKGKKKAVQKDIPKLFLQEEVVKHVVTTENGKQTSASGFFFGFGWEIHGNFEHDIVRGQRRQKRNTKIELKMAANRSPMMSRSLPNMWSITEQLANGKQNNEEQAPFIIGVTGGTASGKTSVCAKIVEELGLDKNRVALISQDCFYKELNSSTLEKIAHYNFDHPGN
jgi:hypothetical protein